MSERTCTCCDSDLDAYQPVSATERKDRDRVPAGRFCKCACLSAHIDDEELVYGEACSFDPEV